MNQFKKLLRRVFYPKPLLIFFLCIISSALLVYVFIGYSVDSPLSYIAYVLSAYTLAAVCCRIPQTVKSVRSALYGNPHIKLYLTEHELRARISVYSGLFIHILYAGFKFASGIYYGSFWFGAEAVYHFILSISQFLIAFTERKITGPLKAWSAYRSCGVIMLFLNLAITAIVFMTVYNGKSFVYSGLIIYATAFYTFYRLVLSFVQIGRFRKRSRPMLSASKYLNLSASLMSLFALQTAMLTQFGDETVNAKALNTATGIFVCFSVIYIAVLMIRRSIKEINNIKTKRD